MNIILGHEAHDPTHLNVKLNYVAVSNIVVLIWSSEHPGIFCD